MTKGEVARRNHLSNEYREFQQTASPSGTPTLPDKISADTVRAYETLTLDTAPALIEATIDGWRLRASGTDTRRSNSATCVEPSSVAPAVTIAAIEQWFDAHKQERVFRMTDQLSPPGMDAQLESMGYARQVDCHFMTRALHELGGVDDAGIEAVGLDAGTRLLHTLTQMDPVMADVELHRQQLWQGDQRFVILQIDGEPAAIGLARIEDSHMGIFSMHTPVAHRGRGYARRIIAALSHWGAVRGAHTAFLQVEADNATAVSVYQKAGFVPAYSYWHRIRSIR